jgi:N-acetylmuramoyl-L-alanine amidase
MAEDYEVQPGDCMSSIGFAHGFFWQTLWNRPENAALKALRKDPHVLMPGDIVHIPDMTPKQEARVTDKRHKFMLKGAPEMLRIRFLDADHKPRANLDYLVVIDGKSRRGKTDGNGEFKESVPPNARAGKILLGLNQAEVINLKLGHLTPADSISGVKSRLANLGYYKGPVDDALDEDTKQALCDYQKKQGLPVTGLADDATKQNLHNLHGH